MEFGGKCNKCGICCQAIPLTLNLGDYEEDELTDGDIIKYNWIPIIRSEAEKINPRLHYVGNNVFFYKCLLFHETFGCLVHLLLGYNEKPKGCREFPWYGKAPSYRNVTMPEFPNYCGFHKDWELVEEFYDNMTIKTWEIFKNDELKSDCS